MISYPHAGHRPQAAIQSRYRGRTTRVPTVTTTIAGINSDTPIAMSQNPRTTSLTSPTDPNRATHGITESCAVSITPPNHCVPRTISIRHGIQGAIPIQYRCRIRRANDVGDFA